MKPMMRPVIALSACLALLACTPAAQQAPSAASAAAPAALTPLPNENWTVDYSKSGIRFSGVHAAKPFQGQFEQFQATIHFAPPDLSDAKAIVEVATGSARTGNKFQEKSLQEGEWFDAGKFPLARFESKSFREVAPGAYEMLGDLTIKGVAVPVVIAFALSDQGDAAVATGRTELDRLALNLGVVSDPKAEWVSAKIPLEITLTATRKPPG